MGAYAIQVSLESRNVCALSVLKDSEGQSDYLPNNVIRLRQCRTQTIQDNLDNRGADLFKNYAYSSRLCVDKRRRGGTFFRSTLTLRS